MLVPRAADLNVGKLRMRIIWLLCLSLIISSVGADESLWRKLKQDPNMIVLMRNAESSGNRDGIYMLSWDATGKCNGESTLTDQGKAHAKKNWCCIYKAWH